MPIGQGNDYYDGINRAEDERVKLAEKIDKWFYDLEDNHKFELLEPYYPDKLHLMGMDEAFEGLDWSEKVSLWEEEQKGFHGVEI